MEKKPWIQRYWQLMKTDAFEIIEPFVCSLQEPIQKYYQQEPLQKIPTLIITRIKLFFRL